MRPTLTICSAIVVAVVATLLPASPAPTAEPIPVTRVAGDTRIAPAVAVSQAWASAETAVLATATDYPDALAGGPLAASQDAPVLLTERQRLPEPVAEELDRLQVRRVLVLGGPAAVSPEVAAAVRSLPSHPEVERIDGGDRYETAAAVARRTGTEVEQVVAASGRDFPDALAAGALAAAARPPATLLVEPDRVPDPVRDALADLRPTSALVIGGPAVLSDDVAAALRDDVGQVERLAGADRYATSLRVLERRLLDEAGAIPLVVASGARFPDALAATPLVGRDAGGLLLVPPARLTDEVDGWLRQRREQFDGVVVVGGPAAVSAHVVDELRAAVNGQPRPDPPFAGTQRPLPASVREAMTGASWRSGCPVGLDDLALLEMTHWGFDGTVHRGRMVVARAVAGDVLQAFSELYQARFPIERMRLVEDYGADDGRSMDHNNTSAFNCRRVTGGTSWSEHSYGTAIDINPIQNPYVRGSTVSPWAGRAYLDRSDVRAGMIVRPGPVTAAFDRLGWGWGGDWQSLKDYQHFSRSGR